MPTDRTETREEINAMWALIEAQAEYGERAYANCGPKE